jgi:hypothetical protein
MGDLSPPSGATGWSPQSDFADLPETRPSHGKLHWLGDDGANVFIEIQGKLACVAVRKGPLKYQPKKRSEIKGFSASSRLRLFKTINRLDFERAGRCTFATMTWRDELGRPEPARITQARSSCQRSIETLAGHPLAGIWRLEWQVRKSGRYVAQYMPHIHLIYFGIPWINKTLWMEAWARSVGWGGHISVKIEEIQNIRKCLYYVSKYIAKLDVLSTLDIPSYLNKYLPGRKWGTYRKNLLPVADKHEFRVPPGELVERIRDIAIEAWEKTPPNEGSGFTVFGPAAEKIRVLVDEWALSGKGNML